MMKYRLKALFVLIMSCCMCTTHAQQQFTRDFFLNETNLPVRVNAMLQDTSGYLWLGTAQGLYKFNGREVKPVDDITRNAITALANKDGEILIGYNNGELAIYDGTTVRPYKITGAVPHTAISDIYTDGAGVLWISTEGEGFFVVINNIGVRCNTANGLSDDFIYNLIVFPNKRVVISTDQGINEVYYEKNKLQVRKFGTEDGLPDNIVRVIKPMPDNTACWVGTQQGGVAFYCRKTRMVWKPEFDSTWHWGQVNDIVPMGRGRAWVATEDGYLLELSTTDMEKVHVRSYHFPGKKMNRLQVGRSGVLWCGTSVGLSMIADEYMSYYPVSQPYSLQGITAMVCDANDNILFSIDNQLYTYNKHTNTTTKQYTAPASVKCLYTGKDGTIWIGTFGKGVYRMKNGVTTHVNNIPSLTEETVLAITGYGNTLWVSGLNGVVELSYPLNNENPELLRIHNKRSGAGSDYVYQVFPDHKGRVWFATDGGSVTMYANGRYKQFTAADGMDSKVIYSINEDAVGRMWASSLGEGLYWYSGDKWHRVNVQHGLRNSTINTIATNATGQVIAVHDNGIDVWYPQSRQFRSYNPRQGIHVDSTSSVQKLFAKDRIGNVYIPFEHGFIVFRNVNPNYDIRPRVQIESMSVFFKPTGLEIHDFNHDQNHISFKYEGVNFANPDKLHYRYRLDGYSDRWIVTNDESVTFPRLSPGKYTFRVQASLNDVFTNEYTANYSFTISLPFWRRWWFVLLLVGALFGVAYLFVTLREKNLRKLSSLQRERMMFEYEHLKSQVNPHFLFNSLNTLASLIEEDKDVAAKYTTHLSDLYRNMLAHRNKDLVTLSEELEILDNYLYIQKSRFGDALKLELDIPQNILKTKKIIPLALQLLVENAIKHNVVSRTSPLFISIKADDETITIRNTLNPKLSKEKGAGLGMVNIKRRYSLLTDKSMYYGVGNKEYVVNLPLI